VFLGPNIRFVLKMNSDSDVRDASVSISYEHRDFAECAFLAVLTVFILLILQVMAKIAASFQTFLIISSVSFQLPGT